MPAYKSHLINLKQTVFNGFAEYWSTILILLTIIGFVSKAFYNYPMGIMAIIGFYRLAKSPELFLNDAIQRLFFIAFLCLWLPLLISLPDAINLSHSLKTALPYLRFLFAGLFIIQELSANEKRLDVIVTSVFAIVIFWCVDASIQFFFGQNLAGFPYRQGDITGMFYPRNTISHICSILSSFCFLFIIKRINKNRFIYLTLMPIPLFFIILLSGRRAAWIMLALSSFGFIFYVYLTAINKKLISKYMTVTVLLIGTALISTALLHGSTNARFKTTLGLFSTDYETRDKATARRLSLWETGLTIFKLNPINGIGPRGFRHAYQEYASPDNYWKSQTHPHLLILEIVTETGLIGLFAYLLLIFLLVNSCLKRKCYQSELPFLIPVLVALFPFNAHMAFYGSIWSSMSWWLIAVYFSCLSINTKKNEAADH